MKFENKRGTKLGMLMKDLDAVSKDVDKASKLKNLKTSSQTLTYENVHVDPSEISCKNGSVYEMNKLTNTAKEKCRKYIYIYIYSESIEYIYI